MTNRVRSTFRFLSRGRADGFKSARPFNVPVKQEVTNEVVEVDGVLLVRLGGCSAMQLKLATPDTVLMRVVPMAEATRLDGNAPWQPATDAQLRSWIASGGAVWQWLLAKGLDVETIGRRLEANAALEELVLRRPPMFALRA